MEACSEMSKTFKSRDWCSSATRCTVWAKGSAKMDIFLPKDVKKDAPVMLFIHGGYWQEESVTKDIHAHIAAPLNEHAAITVTVGYTMSPTCSLFDIVKEIRQAIVFVSDRFPDSRGIYVSGHCAGGHLSVMMLSTDWSSILPEKPDVIKGVCAISGIFDLQPLVRTHINDKLLFTTSSAFALSPMFMVDAIPEANLRIKVHLTVAEFDPPAFNKQTEDYCKLLTARGIDAVATFLPNRDHFDKIKEMHEADCPVQQVLLGLMNLR
ncbi:kynurenine formamidase-like [Diadema setosum]|uniref:kynurenine formamidase-like n=1 Tax=Diadema setosum TaxID=31175 RepID=UPI003B3BBD30